MTLYLLYAAIVLVLVGGICYFCAENTRYRSAFRRLKEDTKPEYEKYRVRPHHHTTHATESLQTLLLVCLLTCAMPVKAVYYGQASRQVNHFWRLDQGSQYKEQFRNELLPQTVSSVVADGFANLYIEYADRICPVSTLADDFCRCLYGARTYRGLSSTQVLMGWIFYTQDWETRQMVPCNDVQRQRRFELIESVCSANVMRILPGERWQSWTTEQDSTGYAHTIVRAIAAGDNALAYDRICALRQYQVKMASQLPSDLQFRCEKLYSAFYFPMYFAAICCVVGLVLYIVFLTLFSRAHRSRTPHWLTNLAAWLNVILWAVLTFYIALRWVIQGHAPVLNLTEQTVAAAWCALSTAVVLSLALRRRGLKGMLMGSMMLVGGLLWLVSAVLDAPLQLASLSLWNECGVLLMLWGGAMLIVLVLLNLCMWPMYLFAREKMEPFCLNVCHISFLILMPALWISVLGGLIYTVNFYC